MSRYDEYKNYMTKEDIELAKLEDQSLTRFILGLILTIPYGAIAFFDVWKMRDALPLVLIQLFPGVDSGNPTRLYTYISILVGGLAWFITFALLWFVLAQPGLSIKKRLVKLAIWCTAAAALYLVLQLMTTLVI